jgi:hypothetical protein
MIKRFFNKYNEWKAGGLRGFVGRLTPDCRITLVMTMLFLLGGLSVYMTVSSIYNFGKKDGERLLIERIEDLRFRQKQTQSDINNLNNFNNGTENNE